MAKLIEDVRTEPLRAERTRSEEGPFQRPAASAVQLSPELSTSSLRNRVPTGSPLPNATLPIQDAEWTHVLADYEKGYFRLREFEKDGRLYEALGIKRFKRYALRVWGRIFSSNSESPDALRRTERVQPGDRYFLNQDKEGLKRFLSNSVTSETVHLTLGALSVTGAAVAAVSGAPLIAGALAANALHDAYFVLLQRYNRGRIHQTLGKMANRGKKVSVHPTPLADFSESLLKGDR